MSIIDNLMARPEERREAAERAAEAMRNHGEQAEAILLAKLDDPRRRRSRRSIRLAIEMIRTKH
jgi:hypothetical protein